MSNVPIKEVIKKEYVKCAQDPVYFLKKYCYIQHPMKGKIPFHTWDFQEKTLRDFHDSRLPSSSEIIDISNCIRPSSRDIILT